MFFSAFKSRKHYVFDYKPRYYDERKERIENLKKKYSENKDADSTRITFSKNNLRNEWSKAKKPAADRRTTLRLAIIITILVGIATYILDLHSLF